MLVHSSLMNIHLQSVLSRLSLQFRFFPIEIPKTFTSSTIYGLLLFYFLNFCTIAVQIIHVYLQYALCMVCSYRCSYTLLHLISCA